MKTFLKLGLVLPVFPGFNDGFSQASISAYLAIPVGDFASSTGGAAETRFGMALSLSKPINENLSAGLEGGFLLNTLDRAAIVSALVDEPGIESAKASGGTYFNFPILGIISYKIPISESNSFVFIGGLGYDFLSMMDMDLVVNGNKGSMEFDASGALAFSLGANLEFGKLFFGARFLNLGDHKLKIVTKSESGDTINNDSSNQEIAVVGIVTGLNF